MAAPWGQCTTAWRIAYREGLNRGSTVSREFVRRIQSGADLPALEQGALSGFEW